MKVVVSVDTHVYQTREPDPTDSWDVGDTAGYVSSVSAWTARNWEHNTGYRGWDSWDGDLDVEPGGYVYAVVADYESGSTFGRDGGHASVVDVFTDIESAYELADLAEGATEYRFTLHGKEYYASWLGYFESLNEMKVWACRVETRG